MGDLFGLQREGMAKLNTKAIAEELAEIMERWNEGETDINTVLAVQCLMEKWEAAV